MTRITWLLPVRNGMPYLPTTLESIASQTYRDWQILAWDNGSTDGTLEELRRWIPDRIPGRIVSDRPLSLGGSLAALVEECDTELCARIDADDINVPDRLERQVAFLDAHPEIAMVGSAMDVIDEWGEPAGPPLTFPTDHHGIVCEMLHTNPIAHPTLLFRREAILASGNYADVLVEDYELWQRVARRYAIANLPERLVHYRVHSQSYTRRALATGRRRREQAKCCAASASDLYGASVSDMRRLREQTHPCALIPLSRIARTLAKARPSGAAGGMRDPQFLRAARRTLSPIDLAGAVTLGALDPGLGIAGGFRLFVKNVLDYLYVRKETARLRAVIAKIRQRQWRRSLARQGVGVPASLELVSEFRPYDRITIGAGSVIERDATIWMSSDAGANSLLRLQERVYVGRNTYFGVYQPITIGANVLIGAYSYIISANHRFSRRDIPIRDQGFTGAPIVIEEDAWIGTHVTILPGVTIGRGAVVAAGSVVNKNIPPYEIWGGAPARFLKTRPNGGES